MKKCSLERFLSYWCISILNHNTESTFRPMTHCVNFFIFIHVLSCTIQFQLNLVTRRRKTAQNSTRPGEQEMNTRQLYYHRLIIMNRIIVRDKTRDKKKWYDANERVQSRFRKSCVLDNNIIWQLITKLLCFRENDNPSNPTFNYFFQFRT